MWSDLIIYNYFLLIWIFIDMESMGKAMNIGLSNKSSSLHPPIFIYASIIMYAYSLKSNDDVLKLLLEHHDSLH